MITSLRIYSLKLEGFMLYRKFYRVFGDKDVIGIIAKYANEKERSNKAAKSTIIEAVLYALTGLSRASREVDLIHRGMDEMKVTLVLIDQDGNKYPIMRGRDIKNVGFIEVERITNSIAAQERINELIGYDEPKDLTLTNFFKQNDINQFMEMKPAQMQKHLMRWFENDHWNELERAAKDDLNELMKKKDSLSAKAEVLRDQLVDEGEIVRTIKVHKRNLVAMDESRKKKIARLEGLKKKAGASSNLETLKAKHETERQRMVDLAFEIEHRNTLREELEDVEDKIKAIGKIAVKTDEKTETNLRKRTNAMIRKMESLNSAVTVAKEQHTGVCPIITEPCDRIKFDKGAVEGWRTEARKIKEGVANNRKTLQEIERGRKLENRLSRLETTRSGIKGTLKRISATDADLKASEGNLKALQKQMVATDKSDVLDRIAQLQDDISEIDKKINSIHVKIGALRQKRKDQRSTLNQLDKYEDSLSRLRRKIEVQRYVVFMFGKNGIAGQEIENGFDEIEDETNYVLDQFGTGLSISFQADRELKPWEPTCLACGWIFPKGTKTHVCKECGTERRKKRKEELAVKVMENEEDFDFNMESGGGKTVVSLGNRIALTRMKQRRTGSRFNVLFLDEPDSALDKPNKRAFMNLITSTLINKFGFEQIFWITHDNTIQESIPHVLQVIRFSTYSKARWL